MSRRIAHRPRYHFSHSTFHSFPRSHRELFHTRWHYRRQPMPFPKRKPGQSLLLIPWGYDLLRGVIPLMR